MPSEQPPGRDPYQNALTITGSHQNHDLPLKQNRHVPPSDNSTPPNDSYTNAMDYLYSTSVASASQTSKHRPPDPTTPKLLFHHTLSHLPHLSDIA